MFSVVISIVSVPESAEIIPNVSLKKQPTFRDATTNCFLPRMTSEHRLQKFHTRDLTIQQQRLYENVAEKWRE